VQDARDKDDYNESHIITAKRALKVYNQKKKHFYLQIGVISIMFR